MAENKLKFASFAGLEFPFMRCSINGQLRDHVHEYAHTPGGNPEKLGRKLYVVSFDALFLERSANPYWQKQWPENLGKLRKLFEDERTEDLHIPTIGTIKAYCTNWDQLYDPTRIVNGETASFKFREDQSDRFLISSIIKVSPATLSEQAAKVVWETEQAGEDPSAWDRLTGAVDDVLAALDQADLYTRLLESKIRYVIFLCDEADRRLKIFQDPANHLILNALKDLWESSLELSENLTSAAGDLKSYIVPVEMTTSDVAKAVFDDASRGGDILGLNAIEDPFAIPAGSKLKYFRTAA